MSPINVMGGTSSTPLVLQDDHVLYNGSKVVVLIGNDIRTPDVPLQPMAGYTLRGGQKYYLQTIDGSTQTLQLLRGHAGSFQLTSAPVPPTEENTPILVVLNQTIAAGTTVTLSNPSAGIHLPVATHVSVVGTIFAQSKAAQGANPYYRLRSQWSNSNDNFDPEVTDDWVCATGPLSFTQNFRHDYTCPTIDDTLVMAVTNYDSVDIGFTIGLFGSYRSRTKFMKGRYPDSLANEANGLTSDGVLLSFTQAAIPAANKGAPVQIPLYPADVELSATLAGEAASGQVQLVVTPMPSSLGFGSKIYQTNRAGILSPQTIKLPRRVCTITVDNTNGTAPVTPTVLITANSDVQ